MALKPGSIVVFPMYIRAMNRSWWWGALWCGLAAVGCGNASAASEPEAQTTGGDGSGPTDTTQSSRLECGSVPITASESAVLGAGLKARFVTQEWTPSDGYAVVAPQTDDDGYRRNRLFLSFTDYPACGYARAGLGKVGGSLLEIQLFRDIEAGPFAPATYTSETTLMGVDSMKGLGADCNRLGSAASGRITISEITPERVVGTADTDWFSGSFDLPICDYPAESPTLACGCSP